MSSVMLNTAMGRLQEKIKNAKADNARKQELEEIISKLQLSLEKGVEARNLTDFLLKQLLISSSNYLNDRKTKFEEELNNVLAIPFPNENYRVRIEWDERGTKPTCKVLISSEGDISKNGEPIWSLPKNVNGEFVKQLISFTIIANMTAFMGSKFFGSDESLNSGDNESLSTIKPLIDKLSEYFQLVFIEHKDSMYNGMTRREINLVKKPGTGGKFSGYVKIDSIDDYTET